MKSYFLFICSLLCMVVVASCNDEEEETAPSFSFSSTDDVTLTSEEGAQAIISFTSTLEWEAAISDTCDWLAISPSEGEAGRNVIVITAITENDTSNSRSTVLTVTSRSLSQTITITQETSDYIYLEQDTYEIDAEGGILQIPFSTTLDSDEFSVLGTGEWVNQDFDSRALNEYSIWLNVEENTELRGRTCYLYFVKDEEDEQTILATVTIVQKGITGSESTDYSADGTVTVLQEASIGNGIPIVLMGDGFIDEEISNGTYDETMEKAFENLFTEEPIKSLKDYFNVYSVTAVSQNNTFGSGETAISCWLEGGTSTYIEGNDIAVMSYVQCVEGITLGDVLAVVILNTDAYAGTTWYGYTDVSTRQVVDFAIAYCPVIYDLESEEFREVLTHEAIGHGFAKLQDEYYYSENGTIPEDEIEDVRELQSYGWAQNVDFTSNTDSILWNEFLDDYTSEGIGAYEGACTYLWGAYRPTDDSMMNSNTVGFNPPSRKAIYDRVMEDGAGTTSTYAGFVTFDQQTQQASQTRSTYTSSGGKVRFARPRFIGKTLSEK